jgi:hypothetical protein
MSRFNRVPSRNEKEPMRNLYLYYKRLKQFISKKEAMFQASGNHNINKGYSSSDQASPLLKKQPQDNNYMTDNKQQRSHSQSSQNSNNLSVDSYSNKLVSNPEEEKNSEGGSIY